MANIGKGLGAIKDAMNSSAVQLKLKNGESAVIRVLSPADEIISVWEHTVQIGGQWKTATCLGKKDCPLCQAGDKASYKIYLLVLDRADNKVKLFKASKTVGMQLLGLVEEYGDLTKRDFKISRQGEKLQTTYQFFPREPEAIDLAQYSDQLPNTEEMVQPMTIDGMKTMMEGGLSSGNEGDGAPASGKEQKKEDFPF